MESRNEWSKDETLEKVFNLILDPSLANQEREFFMRGKQAIERGEHHVQVLEKLQASLEVMMKKGGLSVSAQKFYNEIPLIAGGLVTLIMLNPIINELAQLAKILGETSEMKLITGLSSCAILSISLLQLFFLYLAISRYDGVLGKKWSVFLLFYGILLIFGGVTYILIRIRPLEALGGVIAGILLIESFVLKKRG